MIPWVLVLCLGAEPTADAGALLLTERIQPIVPHGWSMTQMPDGVTIAREAPVALHIRGVIAARPTRFAVVLTMGPRVTPKARAVMLETNAKTMRSLGGLEAKMASFKGGEADSEPAYRPITKEDRVLLQKHEALSKQLTVVPELYVGDFFSVTVTKFHGSGPSRHDEQVDCADCEPLAQAVRARLSVYDAK